MKILVAGGGIDPKKDEKAGLFCRALGRELVSHGHVLVSGNSSKLDEEVASGAAETAAARELRLDQVVISYVLDEKNKRFDIGTVMNSQRKDWSLHGRLWPAPEPIEEADVAILVGGGKGTRKAANWAAFDGTPTVPVPRFGGVAREIFSEELEKLRGSRRPRVEPAAFQVLDQVIDDQDEYARSVLTLAAKLVTPDEAFVVMSFEEGEDLEDLYDSYQTVAKEFGFSCHRIDDMSNVENIIPEIFRSIRRCAFVFADVTGNKPNVFYELGYARALKKPVIVTARDGTKLPFDVHDTPTIFWTGTKRLKDQLRAKIAAIVEPQGSADR